MYWTGPEIKQRRKRHKLTQQQLADAIGVTVSAVSRWEAVDRPRINANHRVRLEQALPTPDGDYIPATPDPWAPPRRFRTNVEWTAYEIVRRRLTLNMTQQQLADAAGVSLRTVSSWESEGRSPSGRHLLRLQEALRLPSDEPDYDPGVPLREATVDDILDRLHETGVDNAELDRLLTQLQVGPLLRDATATELLTRMVELHNADKAAQIDPPDWTEEN